MTISAFQDIHVNLAFYKKSVHGVFCIGALFDQISLGDQCQRSASGRPGPAGGDGLRRRARAPAQPRAAQQGLQRRAVHLAHGPAGGPGRGARQAADPLRPLHPGRAPQGRPAEVGARQARGDHPRLGDRIQEKPDRH